MSKLWCKLVAVKISFLQDVLSGFSSDFVRDENGNVVLMDEQSGVVTRSLPGIKASDYAVIVLELLEENYEAQIRLDIAGLRTGEEWDVQGALNCSMVYEHLIKEIYTFGLGAEYSARKIVAGLHEDVPVRENVDVYFKKRT